jgi:UDP-N-acetylmuramoylalanine--D-glutamate ligase
MPLAEIGLRGDHNVRNVLAACAIAAGAGLTVQAMRTGVADFRGVEHRLEFVRTLDGVQWYNDSKATSPEMAITSIEAFDEPLVVLAGGRDKALPWDEFADLVQRRADHVVLFGEAVGVIDAALKQTEPNYTLDLCPDLESAVAAAHKRARPGDVVLLAPGGTSFDEFSDYEARGDRFKELVARLPVRE